MSKALSPTAEAQRKQAISDRIKAYWDTPGNREKHSALLRKYYKDHPEMARARGKVISQKFYEVPGRLEARRVQHLRTIATPEFQAAFRRGVEMRRALSHLREQRKRELLEAARAEFRRELDSMSELSQEEKLDRLMSIRARGRVDRGEPDLPVTGIPDPPKRSKD